MKVGLTSKGVYNIPNLKYFFAHNAEIILLNRLRRYQVDMVVGWGNKASSAAAKKYATTHKLPYIALEDGFIRSLAPARISSAPLSVILDDKGIYYDASGPSKLEDLIIKSDISEQEIKRAQYLISLLKQHKLSKYNHADQESTTLEELENHILVIDQTYNDLSVSGSLANADSFKNMLEAAIDENPNSTVVVKTHPEVILGYKQGYLVDLAKKYKCRVIAQDINPWLLFNHAQKVYTVSSQMGFEALMAEKQVRCFGIPFYAGWGLTQDEMSIPRRNTRRSLYRIFTAAYIKYPIYLNPFTLKQCEPEEIIPILSLWSNINEENKKIHGALYISKWKQKNISAFLKSTESEPKFYRSTEKMLSSQIPSNKKIVTWASKLTSSDVKLAHKHNISLNFMEDGFLRSVGLGANLIAPQSVVIDKSGIYYDPHQVSDLENIIQNICFSEDLIKRAQNLIKQLNKLEITKYNVGDQNNLLPIFPQNKIKILVVGQVENDASIKCAASDVNTNLGLIEKVRNRNPDAYIIYKPHPDVMAGQRPGKVSDDIALKYTDIILPTCSITSLIKACDELHTISSLAGFEALIRGKKVYCYGLPFYAGWGLTTDFHHSPTRKRKVSVEELIAASLILYPRYLDPISDLWCPPEIIIYRLNELKEKGEARSVIINTRKIWGKIKNMVLRK